MESSGACYRLENIGRVVLEYLIQTKSIPCSVRATSPDGHLVTEWVQITVGPMDNKEHVRVDFTLTNNSKENSINTCDLEPRVPVAPAATPVRTSNPDKSAATSSNLIQHWTKVIVLNFILFKGHSLF